MTFTATAAEPHPALSPDPEPTRPHIRTPLLRGAVVPLAIVGVAVLACGAVTAPLLLYTVSLAMFGLAHVLAEFRYVDARFNPRLGNALRVGFGVLLAAIVGTRVLKLTKVIEGETGPILEVAIVIGLVAIVLPVLLKRGLLPALIGLIVLAGLGFGLLHNPAVTLLVFAWIHNLTPVGFLAERLRGPALAQAMLLCVIAFVILPVLIVLGIPLGILGDLGVDLEQTIDFGLTGFQIGDATFFDFGSLELHMGAYGMNRVSDWVLSLNAFSAAVFLQIMHYIAVIHVLPRLDNDATWGKPRSLFCWPNRRQFTMLMAGLGGVLLLGFAANFGDARSIYGVVAAIHAWVEVPVLLLALALPATLVRRQPKLPI